jgi:DNA primase
MRWRIGRILHSPAVWGSHPGKWGCVKFDLVAYARDHLDAVKISSTGEINASCPWCGKPGHFYVNATTGKYICFKCEERGRNAIGLISHIEGVSRGEAARFIMRQAVQFRRRETQDTLRDRVMALRGVDSEDDIPGEVDFGLPREFRPVYKNGKFRMPIYLKKRGFKKATAKEWGIGYCAKGRYGGRVVIPISCPNGRSFTARDTTGKQDPRYLNPKGADHGRLLLGWEHHDIRGDVTLVEGPLDAIKMWQHGIPALAVMGKVLHSEQLFMLLRKPDDVAITVMFDPEEKAAPYKAAAQLAVGFEHVYIAHLPEGVDPGASTMEQAHEAQQSAARYTGGGVEHLTGMLEVARKKLSELYQ